MKTRSVERTSSLQKPRFETSATRIGRHGRSSTVRSGSSDQDRLDEAARLATEAAAAFEAIGAVPMLARARSLLKLEVLGHTSAPGELAVAQSGPSPGRIEELTFWSCA